jgi:glycosyltransferase involved in cell wall biosynthesis
MIARKGVDTLIETFQRIARVRTDVALLLLGDGPQRSDYESMVPDELRPRVHFAGLVSRREKISLVAAALR